MSAAKRPARSTSQQQTQPGRKVPVLGIIFGVVAVLLIVAVMVAGGEQLGGSEFGEPSITGAALPTVLDSNSADATSDPAFGMPIPEVAGTDFDGNAVSIRNDGTPKAILFISHSCPHCQDEIPEVQAWLNSGGGVTGVDIITVSTAANSAAGNWPPSQWLNGEGWQQPVIADDADNSTFSAFGGQVIPYWVFVDGAGTVTRRNGGRMGIAALQTAMEETTS